MQYLIWTGLFFPLFSFILLLIAHRHLSRKWTGIIASTAILLSFVSFLTLLYVYYTHGHNPIYTTLYKWIPVDKINADFTLKIDPLSLLMTLIITGVGFLIHVYSMGYMEHEEDYVRFFACMNFFVFSMLLLVLAGHLLVLFVGWEAVGLASYLLIGFWYSRPAAAAAAAKAFIINRIGDWGLLLGLLFTFNLFGTGNMEEVADKAGAMFAVGAPLLSLITFLYFIGATGKSAQLPLHTWLPDAMEGPTPVSALIHAATMVTAGVYLVVRMHALFMLTPDVLLYIGDIGAATALFAALCALGQSDLKRVLAYSTVSQLGLMFLACGAGAFYAAMFHLTTHAFVKALLFLSAGNVVHMMHGTTDLGKMGGLAKIFTKTHWLFLIGALALSGIPPLSAFFSKDLILEQEHLAGFEMLFYVGLLASVLTGIYLTRAYCLAFLGKPQLETKILKAVKEAPPIMWIPLVVLAALSIFGGFLGFAFSSTPVLETFLAEADVTVAKAQPNGSLLYSPETWMSIAGALFGVGATAYIFRRYRDRIGTSSFELLRNSFYVDEIYNILFTKPIKCFAKMLSSSLEPKIFEGSVLMVAKGTQTLAASLQRTQSGQIRSYISWIVLGAVIMIVYSLI